MAQGDVLGDPVSSVPKEAGDKCDDQRQFERHDDEDSFAFADVGNRQLHART